jgi:hypothetical protein
MSEEEIIQTAKENFGGQVSDGEIDFDDVPAVVAVTGGSWVAAWVWVKHD